MGTTTSSLGSAIADLGNKRQRCPFGRWIDELADTDPEYHKLVTDALALIEENREQNGRTSKGPTAVWLAGSLRDDGHEWSNHSIGHHLRGKRNAGCGCRN